VRDLARQHTETAINTLVKICEHGEKETARIAAAVALLDRAYGRPTVAVEVQETGLDIGALMLKAARRANEALAAPIVAEAVSDERG
jgi:hypothetical protein